MTDKLIQAAQQALEALETERDIYREHDEDGAPEYILDAITSIQAALAQPVQEPVAWGWRYDSCGHAVVNRLVATETSEPTLFLKNVFARGPFPLYAAPQPEQEPVVCRFCHSKKGCWAWQCYHCGEIDDVQKPAAQPVQEPVGLRDALAHALGGVFGCSRTWSAWEVGTMSQSDFYPAAESDALLDELVQAVAAATPPLPVNPTAQEMHNAAANLALMKEMFGDANQPAAKVNDEELQFYRKKYSKLFNAGYDKVTDTNLIAEEFDSIGFYKEVSTVLKERNT